MTMLAIPAWPDPSTKEGAAFFANAAAYVTALKAHLDFERLRPRHAGQRRGRELARSCRRGRSRRQRRGPGGDRLRPASVACRPHRRDQGGLGHRHRDLPAGRDPGRGGAVGIAERPLARLRHHRRQGSAHMAAYEACVLYERAGAAQAADRRGAMATRWTAWFGRKGF